jgi:hypothetical protein
MMITNENVKKFIDFYNEFKYNGKLTLEQLVFSIEKFQEISYDFDEIVKVINNRSFGDYTQYNLIDFINSIYNEEAYDLLLVERKEYKLCYWIINIEFYKIFNIYRVLIIKTNSLLQGVDDVIDKVSIRIFEKTINNYINNAIDYIRKCLDFLAKNNYKDELQICIQPFKNLLNNKDPFYSSVLKRIFPNVEPEKYFNNNSNQNNTNQNNTNNTKNNGKKNVNNKDDDDNDDYDEDINDDEEDDEDYDEEDDDEDYEIDNETVKKFVESILKEAVLNAIDKNINKDNNNNVNNNDANLHNLLQIMNQFNSQPPTNTQTNNVKKNNVNNSSFIQELENKKNIRKSSPTQTKKEIVKEENKQKYTRKRKT